MSERSRRDFLKTLACGAAACALPQPGCVSGLSAAPSYDVTPYVHSTDTSNLLILAASGYPPLVSDGAIIAASSLLPGPILISRKNGTYYAVSATCTHVGCPLGYESGEVVCPCHQSKFDVTSGKVLNPPALAPLSSYPTSFDATTGALTVVLPPLLPAVVNGSVTLPFEAYPNLKPGQACAGAFVQGTPRGASAALLVQLLPNGRYSAVSPICPHLQGPVSFNCAANQFQCAWHGSKFNADGSLAQGPATRGLTAYLVSVSSDGIVVTLG